MTSCNGQLQYSPQTPSILQDVRFPQHCWWSFQSLGTLRQAG